MRRVRRNLERDSWLIAWAVTLMLHVLGFIGLRHLPAPRPPAVIQRQEPVRLVFVRPGSAKRASEGPHYFSELPADRADKAPKRPDFLSNVTSRARDQAPGGDDAAMPRMRGESDAPTVKLQSDGAAAPPAKPFASQLQSAEPPKSQTAPTSAVKGPSAQPIGPTSTQPTNDNAAADPHRVPALSPSTGATGHSGVRGLAGNSDIDQPEMANPGGNASLTGDISLNTTAWDYAPWLQRFGRQLMRAWIPPPAYSIGILKEGGWATFELEIARSGKLLRLNLLEQQGHPSLTTAAESAIRTMGTIEALPPDFPEPTLILRLRMIYPRIHPR